MAFINASVTLRSWLIESSTRFLTSSCCIAFSVETSYGRSLWKREIINKAYRCRKRLQFKAGVNCIWYHITGWLLTWRAQAHFEICWNFRLKVKNKNLIYEFRNVITFSSDIVCPQLDGEITLNIVFGLAVALHRSIYPSSRRIKMLGRSNSSRCPHNPLRISGSRKVNK